MENGVLKTASWFVGNHGDNTIYQVGDLKVFTKYIQNQKS